MATWTYKKDASGNLVEYKDGVPTGGTSANGNYAYQPNTSNTSSTNVSSSSTVPKTSSSSTSLGTPTSFGGVTPGAYKDSSGNYVTSPSIQRTYDTDKDGNVYLDTSKTDTWTQRSYTSGNADLQYALYQAAKNSGTGTSDVPTYVKSLYDRVGSQRADGSTVSLADVNKELDRLGLSDYNSSNAIYTAGGTILPGGSAAQYGKSSYGDGGIINDGNPQMGNYYTYGGQTYLMGGDYANLAQYANAKTGNLTASDYQFGNLQNNPMIQGDQPLANALNANYQNYLQASGGGTNGGAVNGNFSANPNVNQVINTINSMQNYANASGDSSALNQINQLLSQGVDSWKQLIDSQRTQAQKTATDQARAAWVNQQLGADAAKESLAASGLGTTGALQGAMLGVNNTYGNQLADVNSKLTEMLSNLNEQELKAVADYYNSMGDYAFRANESEQNRNLQYAQMAQSAAQFEREYAMRQQELAMKQQQYEDEKARQDKQDQYNLYRDQYIDGTLTPQGWVNYLIASGNVDAGWYPNGVANPNSTSAVSAIKGDALNNQLTAAKIANTVADTNYMNRR